MTDTQPGYRIAACLVCGERGRWYIMREGDAVVAWADDAHLAMVLDDLRRDRPTNQRFLVNLSAAAGSEE